MPVASLMRPTPLSDLPALARDFEHDVCRGVERGVAAHAIGLRPAGVMNRDHRRVAELLRKHAHTANRPIHVGRTVLIAREVAARERVENHGHRRQPLFENRLTERVQLGGVQYIDALL